MRPYLDISDMAMEPRIMNVFYLGTTTDEAGKTYRKIARSGMDFECQGAGPLLGPNIVGIYTVYTGITLAEVYSASPTG
jgi:hypothetical protein